MQLPNPAQLPPNLIAGTGRIDGDIIALNTKYTGRIETILIEEGQCVHKGNTIAILQSDHSIDLTILFDYYTKNKCRGNFI